MSLAAKLRKRFTGNPKELVEAVTKSLAACTEAIPTDAPRNLRDPLEKHLSLIARDEIHVAIGGLFNAGKSTLINRIIGWEILPNSKDPETGAPSYIRRGRAKSARVTSRSGKRTASISPTQEAVAAETSLYRADGSRRTAEELAAKVEIEAPDLQLDDGVVLIDLPGFRDTGEMDEVALEVAMGADLVLWVCRSEPAFSQQDAEFLSTIVGACGSDIVRLALNVMSEEPNDRWESFQAAPLNAYRTGIARYLKEMGLQQQHLDSMILFDAKRFECERKFWFVKRGGAYGGTEVRQLFDEISHRTHLEIRRARLPRILAAANRYDNLWLQPRIAEATSEYQQSVNQWNAYQKRAARQAELRQCLAAAIHAAFLGLEEEFVRTAEAVGRGVSAAYYQAGENFAPSLISRAQASANGRLQALVSAIVNLSSDNEATMADARDIHAVKSAFISESAIEDAIGDVYSQEIELSFKRAFNWIAGKFSGEDKSVDEAVYDVRWRLERQAKAAGKLAVAQRENVRRAAEAALRLIPLGPEPAKPDLRPLEALKRSSSHLGSLKETLEKYMQATG